MSKLLTFEWDENNELLEIHGNNEGLKLLREKIDSLITQNDNDHLHLMAPSWGGEEITELKQSLDNNLISHVKIFKWKD